MDQGWIIGIGDRWVRVHIQRRVVRASSGDIGRHDAVRSRCQGGKPNRRRAPPTADAYHSPVNPEIARELFLSPHTIKSRMKSIYRKLDATSRSQAVAR